MELVKAIEILNKLEFEDYEYSYNGLHHNIDTILIKQAIDTVLEELNNSISKDKIENKIKELKEKLENVRNKEDRIRNGVAIIVLEYCIDSMNEILNKE